MKKIRTIVIDDEPLARARIVKLLESYVFVDLVGEGKNGQEAVSCMLKYQPDLVFLDIQMPDFNGFEALQRAGMEQLPFIIFVTAYDQYALRAFDVHAVDYLLKPFDNDRFHQAVEHARQQIQLRQQAVLQRKMQQLFEEYHTYRPDAIERIEVQKRGVSQFVHLDDIYYIEAHGNYLKLHLAHKSFLIRQTLQGLAAEIDRSYFLRVHRSLLLNTHYVEHIQYAGNNQYRFKLKNGKAIMSSRSHRETIEDFLKDEALKQRFLGE